MKVTLSLLILCLFTGCTNNTKQCQRLLYSIDENGDIITGEQSKKLSKSKVSRSF